MLGFGGIQAIVGCLSRAYLEDILLMG